MKTVRSINAACFEALEGRAGYVYAIENLPCDMCFPSYRKRIIRARSVKGQLQGRVLGTGAWINIAGAEL